MNNPRAHLWTALGGVLVGVLGVGWDMAWHSRQPGGGLAGAEEVLEAHWLMILGVLIIFVALALAVRSIRGPRPAVVATWIALVGSISMAVGFAWDSARHIQGTESPTAHALIYVGLAVVVVAVPVALLHARSAAARWE